MSNRVSNSIKKKIIRKEEAKSNPICRVTKKALSKVEGKSNSKNMPNVVFRNTPKDALNKNKKKKKI